MVYENSAGAVIFRLEEKRVLFLLLHYTSGHWDFVKGHIEKDESDFDTMIRETKEETGITDLKVLPDFKEEINYLYHRDRETVFKTVRFCLAKTRTQKVKLSFEHQGYIWLDYKEAMEKLTFKNAKSILSKAAEPIKTYLNLKSL